MGPTQSGLEQLVKKISVGGRGGRGGGGGGGGGGWGGSP